MLEIHNISRSYTGSSQTHTVIDHLNLTVCGHDFFVIVSFQRLRKKHAVKAHRRF